MEGLDLEIFDKPFEESYEMLCFSDVSRNSFLKKVLWEN
jgi:hypothetical protein